MSRKLRKVPVVGARNHGRFGGSAVGMGVQKGTQMSLFSATPSTDIDIHAGLQGRTRVEVWSFRPFTLGLCHLRVAHSSVSDTDELTDF
jgi:hypothetical protein